MKVTRRDAPDGVSVIIPNLNGGRTLGFQLEALAGQDFDGDWEVILADNGSTDESVQVALSWRDRLPALKVVHAERRGAGAARNAGASLARSDFLAFCDSDDVVDRGWVRALSSAALNHDVVGGAIEQELLNADSDFPRPDVDTERLSRILGRFSYVPAGNCGIWSDVFDALGGWNEDFSICMEDQELSIRAALAGYDLGLAPGAVVHYRHREDLRSFVHQQFRYAREEVRLYREFRHTGVRRNRRKTVLKAWAWLGWHLPDAFRSGHLRADWLRKGATRVGRLVGSVRYRTVFL